MRINAFVPTDEEVGDPWESLRRQAARIRAQRPPVKNLIRAKPKAVPPPPPEPEPEPEPPPPPPPAYPAIEYTGWATARECMLWVCQDSGVTYWDIIGVTRSEPLVTQRHRAIWLTRRYGDPRCMSLPHIGRRFGGRDHTTVLHALRRVDRQILDGKWTPPTFEQVTGRLPPEPNWGET